MTCRHRWMEPQWVKKIAAKRVNANLEYFFACARCNECRFVTLIGSSNDQRT